jgi:transcriptional regulator with XRE-family HTH domain
LTYGLLVHSVGGVSRAAQARVRAARKQAGTSQASIARTIGVGASIYAKWEQGRRALPTKARIKLARALNLPLDELLTREERSLIEAIRRTDDDPVDAVA